MGTVTLRGIDDAVTGALKEKARREDTSVNTVLLKIIKESLGIEKKKRNVVYHDLDHLAGTWTAEDLTEFERATAAFDKIDEEMWK